MKSFNNIMQVSTITSLLLSIFFFPLSIALGQDGGESISSRISMSCIQQADEQVNLNAKLRYRLEGQYYDIRKAEVVFFARSGDEEIEIGRSETNEDGEAQMLIQSFEEILPDGDGYYSVYASYVGDDKYNSSDSDLLFKRAKLDITTTEEDGVYSVSINTYELNEDRTPIGDQDVSVLIPRMFSNLKVANDYSDEEGNFEAILPNDLPGDENGNIDIIVRIPDTDDYGTLEGKVTKAWGIPVSKDNVMATRELWSPDPPFWMLITFIVLMGLVWGHYGIIIWQLFKLSKSK